MPLTSYIFFFPYKEHHAKDNKEKHNNKRVVSDIILLKLSYFLALKCNLIISELNFFLTGWKPFCK